MACENTPVPTKSLTLLMLAVCTTTMVNVSQRRLHGQHGSSAFDTFGKLTPKQCEAILKGIDARAAKKAEWASEKAALNANRAHIGTVGEKATMTLTTVHIVVLDGMYGTTYIFIMEDAEQNVVIYKGKSDCVPNKGETATLTATVKEHGVRDGVKQTIIQRPKAAK
jgi:hypothetical protein